MGFGCEALQGEESGESVPYKESDIFLLKSLFLCVFSRILMLQPAGGAKSTHWGRGE